MRVHRLVVSFMLLLSLVLAFAVAPGLYPGRAQEVEPDVEQEEADLNEDDPLVGDEVVCNNAIMMLTLIALRQYGYSSSFDLDRFAWGELEEYFQNIGTGGQQSDEQAAESEPVATGQQGQGGQGGGEQAGEAARGAAATVGGSGGDIKLDMTEFILPTPNFIDHETTCAQLYTEVYFYLLNNVASGGIGLEVGSSQQGGAQAGGGQQSQGAVTPPAPVPLEPEVYGEDEAGEDVLLEDEPGPLVDEPAGED